MICDAQCLSIMFVSNINLQLTLYRLNAFFIVIRDIAKDRLFSSTDS